MSTENRHPPEIYRKNKGLPNVLFKQNLIAKGRYKLGGKKERKKI